MHLLLKAAFRNPKHYLLLLITIMAMVFGNFASVMEIFSLRVIMDKGVDFFSLFKEENVQIKEGVTLEEVQNKWAVIKDPDTDQITIKGAQEYLFHKKKASPIDRFSYSLKEIFRLQESMLNLAIFIAIVAVLKAITQFTQKYAFQLVSIRVSRDLRLDYFDHLQDLSMDFHQKYKIGELSSRAVADASIISDAINSTLVNYLEAPLKIGIVLAICFTTSVKLSIIIFLAFPLLIMPLIFFAYKVKRVAKQIQHNQENFTSGLIDFLSGIQTIKLFSMEDYSLSRYRLHNDQMASLAEKNAMYSYAASPVLHLTGSIFLAGIIVYGIYFAGMGIPQLFLFCAALQQLYAPLKKFADENNQIMRGVAAAERMYSVLNVCPQVQDKPDAVELQKFTKSIEFQNVWFKYENEWVLKGISFTINKGETVAIIGPTGAGKSTIFQLLPRLYDVEKGEILIDGKNIKEYTQKSVREQMAFVAQKPFLFFDTIAGNIAFGREFKLEEIKKAAKKAYIDTYIRSLPNGYDSQVSEGGKNLSGGQQQRLAIARALFKNASVLLMDEATSALDAVSESHIKQAITELHGKVTQIIVAHRLSTIEGADKIIYIDNGQKLAEGTKDQLLQVCPEFKKMWQTYVGTSPL